MNQRQMRALARRNPAEFLRRIRGARRRELEARHLLLHPEEVRNATAESLASLEEYVQAQGWRSLYHHDRAMYRLLKAGASKLRGTIPHGN